jgi:uncharacterized damage-inducible protein DinB
MTAPQQIAKHFNEVYFGGNWTFSNMKDQLADVSWEQAITKVHSFNTIATLVYHISYFVDSMTGVLKGGPLEGKDELSFDHPSVQSQDDWEQFLDKVWNKAEDLTELITQLPEDQLWQTFTDEKYGIYYRNLHGIIEHTHYHLGQIAIIKKLVVLQNSDS